MKNITNICPTSSVWLSAENQYVAGYFEELGFDSLQQILDMRVFDLMNMNRLNPVYVEEILICLYRFLNNNSNTDQAMYEGSMSQDFSYTAWNKRHNNCARVKVADIVMAEDMNLKALQHIYDKVRKWFFKSDEYSWREYKYLNYREYLDWQKTQRGGKH